MTTTTYFGPGCVPGNGGPPRATAPASRASEPARAAPLGAADGKGRAVRVLPSAGQIFDATLGDLTKWPLARAAADGVYLQWCWAIAPGADRDRVLAARRAMCAGARCAVLEAVHGSTPWLRELELVAAALAPTRTPLEAVMVYKALADFGGTPEAWNPTLTQAEQAETRAALAARAAELGLRAAPALAVLAMPQHFMREGLGERPKGREGLEVAERVCFEVPVPCEGWVLDATRGFLGWLAARPGKGAYVLMYPATGTTEDRKADITAGALDLLDKCRDLVDRVASGGAPGRLALVPANYDEATSGVPSAPESVTLTAPVVANGGVRQMCANSNTGAALALANRLRR